MTVGNKIRSYRLKNGLTQKELAVKCGYSESAIRNYELDNRSPNMDQLQVIADALDINVYALSEPALDTYIGATHTLFAMEDLYGLHPVTVEDGQVYLTFDQSKGGTMQDNLYAWAKMFDKMRNEQISEDEYKNWKAKFPKSE